MSKSRQKQGKTGKTRRGVSKTRRRIISVSDVRQRLSELRSKDAAHFEALKKRSDNIQERHGGVPEFYALSTKAASTFGLLQMAAARKRLIKNLDSKISEAVDAAEGNPRALAELNALVREMNSRSAKLHNSYKREMRVLRAQIESSEKNGSGSEGPGLTRANLFQHRPWEHRIASQNLQRELTRKLTKIKERNGLRSNT